MGGHVFISYSHKDSEYVARLKLHLAAAGLAVWTDDGIDYGAQWPTVIQRKIEDCGALLPVMSPHSRDSDWVQREIVYAQHLRKPIFPLLLAGRRFMELITTQDEDVTDGSMPCERFIAALVALAATGVGAPGSAPTPASPKPAGRVVAWGQNGDGQTTVPSGLTDVIAVAAGGYHSLALHRDGHVTAWGNNSSGAATVPPDLTDVIAIAAGGYHSMAIVR